MVRFPCSVRRLPPVGASRSRVMTRVGEARALVSLSLFEVERNATTVGARPADGCAGEDALKRDQVELIEQILDVELPAQAHVLVQSELFADREIKDRVRADEATLEVHLIENLIGELVCKLFARHVRVKLDAVTAVVATRESKEEAMRQAVVARLEDGRVALILFDLDALPGLAQQVNRFA